MSTSKDLACILRALQLIVEAQIKLQSEALDQICRTSSIQPLARECFKKFVKSPPNKVSVTNITSNVRDGAERLNTVVQGLRVYADLSLGNGPVKHEKISGSSSVTAPVPQSLPTTNNIAKLSQKLKSPLEPEPTVVSTIPKTEYQIKLTKSDKELLEKLDMEHRAKLVKQAEREREMGDISVKKGDEKTVGETINESQAKVTSVPNPKAKLKLNENAKQRKVPSSRIGRMVSFGSLAAGLGVGTAAEYLKQTFGFGDVSSDGTNLFMSKANLDRIVDTLCKVRGAALKLGQILSIQDESIISPELAQALERVRKSADFMPDWQVDQVMSSELGPAWQDNFADFERRPFAAASIGQVHYGKLQDGKEVAIKIQYPGVAKGIESDIDNLGGIMKMWNIFPKGMFLENLMAVAKRELAWEVDYIREAECTKKFKVILTNYDGFYVPDVVDSLTTRQVFTTELLDGVPVDQCFEMELEHRELIGEKIMELCLLEILRFKYMQTDPNWANFLYNPSKKQLLLLDFGASREYSKEFMDKYVQVLKGACDGDRDIVLNVSRQLGFLTGYESKTPSPALHMDISPQTLEAAVSSNVVPMETDSIKQSLEASRNLESVDQVMEDAHVDAVMILGEIFRTDGKYDFAHQDMTYRIQNLAQIMLVHRLCPPPEEVYSLHRKLSGVFLLLAKLKVKVECRQKFLKLYEEYMRLNPPQAT